MGEVVKLQPVSVGEGYKFDPDTVLEEAKGNGFDALCVIGQYPDGSMWISGNVNTGETMILLERVKHHLVFGE